MNIDLQAYVTPSISLLKKHWWRHSVVKSPPQVIERQKSPSEIGSSSNAKQESLYFGIKVQSPPKSITTIPAIPPRRRNRWNTLPVLSIPQKNDVFHLLFLYFTSSCFEKLSKGMQSKSLSTDISLLSWSPSVETVVDQNQRNNFFFLQNLTFYPLFELKFEIRQPKSNPKPIWAWAWSSENWGSQNFKVAWVIKIMIASQKQNDNDVINCFTSLRLKWPIWYYCQVSFSPVSW